MQMTKNGIQKALIGLSAAVLLAAPAVGGSLSAKDTPLVFKQRGEVVSRLKFDQLRKLVQPAEIKVFEYQDEHDRTYVGFALDSLFEMVYGREWREREDVLFTCADGYQPVVPLSEFTKYPAFLAFQIAGQEKFEVVSKIHGGKSIELGPYYVVWKNLGNPELKAAGPSYWPFQVTAIDLINFRDHAPKLAPPSKASDEVKEGFALYRKNCVGCHQLDGQGGDSSGVELNLPHSVTEYFNRAWLARWIEDPKAVRDSARMPAFPLANGYAKAIELRRSQIEKIIRYLEAMAKKAR